ncbi:MAG: cytidylate kinase-like family protein [Verrucomicrobiota bacterium]|jgi:cytidylate kinase
MIDVEDYIKKQIAVFQANELQEKRLENRERRPGRGREGNLFYGPYLLISREKGGGGNTVAQLVGRRLGWQVFNNEIVDEIAQKAHVRRQLIESLDERDRATIQDIIGQLLNPEEIGTSGYLVFLKQIVLTLGHQGDVIIVGRGARYILPSQFGLSVRMIAPIEARIRRIADKARLSLDAARVEVERIDRERVKFVRRHFGHNVTDPLSYDLTINTAALNVEAAAEVVITALQRKLGVQLKESGQK